MPVEIYSAPGRSEVGGNHTDHQHGRVLAASVSLDAIAVAGRVDEPLVRIQSEGYKLCEIRLDELDKKTREEGTTKGLIRGVLAGLKQQGYKMGGFCAYITSDVLSGSGLSSSATFETLIGTVQSCGNSGSNHCTDRQICGKCVFWQAKRTDGPDGMCHRRHGLY